MNKAERTQAKIKPKEADGIYIVRVGKTKVDGRSIILEKRRV